jgi:hypothetical protein
MLNVAAGIDTLHVPYKGSTPAITDMMGQRVDFAFFGISGPFSKRRPGQIRMLANQHASSARRSSRTCRRRRNRAGLRAQFLVRLHGARGHAEGDREPHVPGGRRRR